MTSLPDLLFFVFFTCSFDFGRQVADSLDTTEGGGFDHDDLGFLAKEGHPLLVGQESNGMGRYKRVFIEHKVIRKVRSFIGSTRVAGAFWVLGGMVVVTSPRGLFGLERGVVARGL